MQLLFIFIAFGGFRVIKLHDVGLGYNIILLSDESAKHLLQYQVLANIKVRGYPRVDESRKQRQKKSEHQTATHAPRLYYNICAVKIKFDKLSSTIYVGLSVRIIVS